LCDVEEKKLKICNWIYEIIKGGHHLSALKRYIGGTRLFNTTRKSRFSSIVVTTDFWGKNYIWLRRGFRPYEPNKACLPENSRKHLPLTGHFGYIRLRICEKVDK